jgi:23S rRNA (cytidine1920-2'-O)/16S rRNA (cytidine1409-2'-O)-methyltransferase
MPTHTLALLDLLKRRFPARSEKELAAQILRGGVIVDGEKLTKPGVRVREDAALSVREQRRYVSRGGEKLAAAIDAWSISCAGAVWIDAGSSTGGFTDCLLQHEAACVHAVDVGVGQLDWSLRNDPRVRLHEGANVMALGPDDLDPAPRSATADLSFRSLHGAARHILSLTAEGWGIFLVKPQFEYAGEDPDFHGVLRDAGQIRGVLLDLVRALEAEGVYTERGMVSPIRGRKGNREMLFLLRAGDVARRGVGEAVVGALSLE